jgi:hypothetical protein
MSTPDPAAHRALLATIAAALLPGAGHLILRQSLHGLLLLTASALGGAAAAGHLGWGLELFESPLGAFLFGVLLRALAILYAYSVIDVYFRAVSPAHADDEGARMRLAVLLNLLVPGVGYLITRAWLRAVTGLALLALVLFFAKAGTNRYIDIVFLVLQLIMAFAVLRQQTIEREKEAEQQARRPPPIKAPVAQIVVLVTSVAAVLACGFIVEQAFPDGTIYSLDLRDMKAESTKQGVRFSVARLGLSLLVPGERWTIGSRPRYLFVAEQGDDAAVLLGVQAITPFTRQARFLRRVRQSFEKQGLVHQKTIELKLNGTRAWQMRFSGDFEKEGRHIDHWAIAVPRDGFSYVMMMYCTRSRCEELAASLQQTVDSFTLARK